MEFFRMKNIIFGLILLTSMSAKAADFTVEMTVHPGQVLAYTGVNCPPKTLKADGSLVEKATYPALYAVTGSAHGETGTKFNLPDYRGRFLRMADGGVARDADRGARTAMNAGGNTGDNVGSVQGYATARPVSSFTTGPESAAHTHAYNMGIGGTGGSLPAYVAAAHSAGLQASSGTQSASHNHTVTGGGDSETRPLNANITYCVTY